MGLEKSFEVEPIDEGGELGAILRPKLALSVEELATLFEEERSAVDEALLQYGALLLRGSATSTPQEFERVAKSLTRGLKNDYLGTSPRNAVTEYVHNASELPPFYPIPQHCEMSFVANPPERLLFSCHIAPAAPGGETPIADFRRMLDDLDPNVRERFERLGVRIVRNYRSSAARGAGPFQLKPWDALFGTEDREEIERICEQNDFSAQWIEGDRLRLIHFQAATRPHPADGRPIWFNHSQVFHPSQARGEYRRIAERYGRLKMRTLSVVASALSAMERAVNGEDGLAMNCTYGDGSPISFAEMEAVRDAIWKNMRIVPWERGDILLLDNFRVAHGRMPYKGPRQIHVAWS